MWSTTFTNGRVYTGRATPETVWHCLLIVYLGHRPYDLAIPLLCLYQIGLRAHEHQVM